MHYTISNSKLSLTVDSMGAQMLSLKTADGTEYLWQGDPTYWKDRAPVLFPWVGRLTNNSYLYKGTPYTMGIHGFAAASEFICAEKTEEQLTLQLCSTEKTLKQYPFRFCFEVIYTLSGSCVEVTYRVRNAGTETMFFGIGGHPGFRVPLTQDGCFEDYQLVFSEACQPDRVGFSKAVYLNGEDRPYSLEQGKTLPLRHDLFDEDAIILKNMAREVTLRSDASGRGVCVSYPDMPYLGIWHWPGTDAPYVCIEPWTSLPARQDVVEEISCKSDLIRLAPEKTYENQWQIKVF